MPLEGGEGVINRRIKLQESKNKINVVVPVLLLILISAVVIFGAILTRQTSEKRMEESLQEEIVNHSVTLRDKIDSQFAMLNGLATAFTQEDINDLTFVLERLTECSKKSDFITLDFAYPNGIAYRNDGKEMDLSGRWYFKQCMKGQNAIEFLDSGLLVAEERIGIAVPVIPKDEVAGVLVGDYNKEQFQKVFDAANLHNDEYAYLCDGSGRVVVGTTKGMEMLRKSGGVENKRLFSIFEKAEFSSGSLIEMKSRMQYRGNGLLIYTQRGDKWYTLYEPIGINDWYLVTVLPEAYAFHETMAAARITYMMAVAIIIAVTAIIIFLALREHKRVLLEKERAEELQYILEHDDLTGVLCEKVFQERVKGRLLNVEAEEYCLVYLDVYKFKLINEMFGYEKGDELLCAIAEELEQVCLEYGGMCGRIAGDKFILYLPNQQEIIQLFYTRKVREKKILPVEVYLHYGIYVIKNKEIPVSRMIDCAQLAQKAVKGNYDNYVAYYDEHLKQKILREQEIISSMSDALRDGEFVVYLQPQYSYRNGKVSGAEALVRWNSPEKGLVSPGEFIPIFETNGFIIRLDEYVWEQVCLLLRKWLDEGKEPVALSVNVSRADLLKGSVAQKLTELIEKYQLTPDLLRVEITESAYMDNPQKLIMEIESLQKAGFVVEMDDFGSGYSSLNTLKDVPIDVLKTDLKFLSDTGIEERKIKILGSVIGMAHQMDMLVIAEGVETKAQADYLLQLNCEYMQGFYFSRPIPVENFEKLVYGVS